MTRSGRLLLAFVLAPLCAPFVATITELLFGGYPSAPGHFGKYWESVVPLYFLTGYVLGFGLGTPVFLMLTNRLTIANCIQWGALVAITASLVFLIFVPGFSDLPAAGIILIVASSALAAALDALAFGLIAGLTWRAVKPVEMQTATANDRPT